MQDRPTSFWIGPLAAIIVALIAAGDALSQDQTEDTQATDDETQQIEQQDSGGQTEAEQPAENAPSFQPVKGKRTLYFVGPGVQAQRQTGPIVGAPKTILPQPFVPVGTVALPAPVDSEATSDDASNALEEDANNPDTLETDTTDDGQELTDIDQEGDGLTTDNSQNNAADDVEADNITVAELEQLDPSGIPVALEGVQATDTVWQGYSRAAIVKFLKRAAEPNQSLAMRQLARDIAASRFILPLPEQDLDIDQIIAARLAVFEAQGDAVSYAALIEALPKDRAWPALARQIATARLLQGRLVDACAHGDVRRAIDSDPYWVKLAAFCMAANGNRAGVDFELSILEEAVRLDDSFYRLIDFILLEAEQPEGSIVSDPVPLTGTLKADVMSASMARLARVLVEEIDLEGASMLALPMLLSNPNLSEDAQIKVAQFGKRGGYSNGAHWLQFAGGLLMTDEMRAFILDGDLAGEAVIAGGSEDVPVEESSGDADQPLEFQIDPDIAHMAAIVSGEKALRDAALASSNVLQSAAPFAVAASAGWEAGDISPDMRVRLSRLAALVGDDKTYRYWSRSLRSTVAGENPEIDVALIDLVPVFALEGSVVDPALIGRWYSERAARLQLAQSNEPDGVVVDDAALDKAGLLFAVMDAMQKPVGEDNWQRLDSTSFSDDGKAVSPRFWRLLNDAHSRKDPLDTLYLVMGLMKDVRPGEISAASAAAVLKALQDVGFEKTARRLAAEIMVEQGL